VETVLGHLYIIVLQQHYFRKIRLLPKKKINKKYELGRINFLLSLRNLGNHLKVKSCQQVEIDTFRVLLQ
jgi:hypothetical protein